ncbi:MAG: URC4/urg3 family protein [Bacteriovoracaceae bacterium]
MKKKIEYLLTPKAIRERTAALFDLTLRGKTHFNYHPEKLRDVADFTLEVIKENYPDLDIPFHSRWGHFQAGGVDRNSKFNELLKDKGALEKARSKLDLVITSVLLDAGAGPEWKFVEDDKEYNRSEGLGVASWHMFCDGYFSVDGQPKADGSKLKTIEAKDIEQAFQVGPSNPLVGAPGRASLLKALGNCVESNLEVFKDARPGNILDHMIAERGKYFAAQDLLKAVLIHFGEIWPSRLKVDGVNLGDVWRHSGLEAKDELSNLVPFHKLSQWLTYSLIEPIQEAGVEVHSAHEMTGLAEYRNGGLLLDSGLITLKDPGLKEKAHRPDSELIIEWRALTVALLDKLAPLIRESLGVKEENFPLAKILEGGTWHAGRRLAKEKRSDASPPLKLESDGTVF